MKTHLYSFKFSLDNTYKVTAGLVEIYDSMFPNVLNLDALDADLYKNDGGHWSLVSDYTAATGVGRQDRSFATGVLGAGDYRLNITGIISGAFGGYHLAAAVAAVPEPSEYLMLLAGLGIVGYAVRRRRM